MCVSVCMGLLFLLYLMVYHTSWVIQGLKTLYRRRTEVLCYHCLENNGVYNFLKGILV